MLRGHLWLAAVMHRGFHKLIPNSHQCKQEMTQRYMDLSGFSKALSQCFCKAGFPFRHRNWCTESQPKPHSFLTSRTAAKVGYLRQRRAFQCMEYALNSLLSDVTHRALWVWSRSHMAKAAQNVAFLCSANLLFQYFVFTPNCDGKRMFVIGLKLQKHFSETFINEEKQADIFQAERFHCFLLN